MSNIKLFIKMLSIMGISLFGLSACVATNTTYQNGSSYGSYQPKPSTSNGFVSEKWFLTEINNAGYQGKRITLNLSSTNKIGGYSGCNRYFSSNVKVAGSRISLGSIASTKKLCSTYEVNNLERRYLDILKNITHFQRSRSRLILEGRTGNLIFHKKNRR